MRYLDSIDSFVPTWPQILGVLVAVWLVFGWALWAHPRRESTAAMVSGPHRPERIAALAAPAEAAAAFQAAHRQSVVQLAAQVRIPANLLSVDDWTADLPTTVLAGSPGVTLVEGPPPVTSEPARHSSPSQRARERWQVECPIFTGLAQECGYDPRSGDFTLDLAAVA